MEHLFFDPGEDTTNTKFAFENDVLSTNWTTIPDLIDFISPETQWLDFPHDEVPRIQELHDYPLSLGWNTDKIWNGHLKDANHDLNTLDRASVGRRVASFLQAWLYFGLLETFLGKKVEVSYLMRPNSKGCNTLYTRNLHFCLQARVFFIRINRLVNDLSFQQNMEKSMLLARDWLLRLTAFGIGRFKQNLDKDYPGFMDLISETTPAIIRLVEAMVETMFYVFQGRQLQSLANLHVPWAAVESRRTRLRQIGWCEFQIHLLESGTNQSIMDWLANTPVRQDTLGHEHCTTKACARNNVDISTYEQLHCVPNCRCLPLFPDETQVEEVLKRNQLPVICVESPSGRPQLTVQATDKGKIGDYIAISHVWVDGLGGSTEKGLLTCQVLRIHALVTKLTGSSSGTPAKFWLDSLCIPGKKSNMFREALIGIRHVYSCASSVLVIDRLAQKCLPSASTEILLASIYMSAWMQRMWTYEEAVLAKRLVFLLGDNEFLEYDHRIKPTMRPTVSGVWRRLTAQLSGLRINEGKFNIGHVYLAFRFRLTNATGDEFLSVASMLGFSASQLNALENVRGEDRAKDFWLMLEDIPAGFVFTEGPKLSFPGFQWAPKTMMYPTETWVNPTRDSQRCICTKDGLLGTYLHLHFDRRLQGCNAYPHKRLLDRVMKNAGLRNQNFIIWVENDIHTNVMKEKGMAFRVYCYESWPAPPDFAPFDSVIIQTPENITPSPGQMWPAVALLHDGPTGTSQEAGAGDNLICRYVGRGTVERLRMEEFAHKNPTIMHTGANYTMIEARGELQVRNLCIT